MKRIEGKIAVVTGGPQGLGAAVSAPHEFDIARFVLGAEYAVITALQGASDGPIAPVFMVLGTTGGQLVNIEINSNAA